MCGRYGRWSRRERLEALLTGLPLIDQLEEWRPSYNAAPGVPQPIIRATPDGGEATIQAVLWGLVPFFAKDPKAGPHPINAQAETAKDKPMFQKLIRERRCLVPADCFYEWKETPAGKIPHAVRLASEDPFFLAGLWDIWHARKADALHTFTILTTEPNALLKTLHNRMPLIIRPEDAEFWLHPDVQEIEEIEPLLEPYPAEEMIAYPVSARVSNVRNDSPDLIEPA